MLSRKNKVAVLVLNYNGSQFLKNCFDSLNQQTYNNFDVWLVDNNSSDKSIEFTKENYPKVKIFNTKENLGYSGSYNKIHDHFKKHKISYEYYLFLNNDTICDKKMISSLVDGFYLKKNIGITTPIILDKNKMTSLNEGKFLFLTGTTLGSKLEKYSRHNSYTESFWASGCCFMTPAVIFDKLGGFADYFIYYEDLDYSWMVRNLDLDVIYMGNTYVVHLQGGSKTPSEFQAFLIEKNRITAYYRNLPLLLFLAYLPILISTRLILLPYFAPSINHIMIKIKAILSSITNLHRHSRRPSGILRAIRVILSMNKINRKKIYV